MPREVMKDKLTRIIRKCIVMLRIRQIKSRDFSIIASNCTGTLPYRFLGNGYTSPTVNLYFFAPDYIKFAKHLDHYLSLPLKFVPHSRYEQGEAVRAEHGYYPVGQLGDIEIHFMHYVSESDAADKWNRRKKRINRDKLVFAFTDRDLCTPELLAEFDALPYKHKFVLTANEHPEIKSSIFVPKYRGRAEMGDAYTNYDALVHVNFAKLFDSHGATQGAAGGESTSDKTATSTASTVVTPQAP